MLFSFNRSLASELAIFTVCLTGCVSSPAGAIVGTLTDKALEAVGIKASGTDSARGTVALELLAGEKLNAAVGGKAASVVVRIYKLRDMNGFVQASYDALADGTKSSSGLGADVIDVREVTLIPGQRYATPEALPQDAAYIGVAALFHNPAPYRWRYVFRSSDAKKTGITLALHACAMSVARGAPADGNASTATLYTSAICS